MFTDILLTIIAAELFYIIIRKASWYRAFVTNLPYDIRRGLRWIVRKIKRV